MVLTTAGPLIVDMPVTEAPAPERGQHHSRQPSGVEADVGSHPLGIKDPPQHPAQDHGLLGVGRDLWVHLV